MVGSSQKNDSKRRIDQGPTIQIPDAVVASLDDNQHWEPNIEYIPQTAYIPVPQPVRLMNGQP